MKETQAHVMTSVPQAGYVPVVTRDDVLRIVRRDFAATKVPVVLVALDGYGNGEPHRVHLAILKLSDGDPGGYFQKWHSPTRTTVMYWLPLSIQRRE